MNYKMNSEVFLEEQYYLCYCNYVASGIILYKSRNSVLNVLLKIYSVWGPLMIVTLLPMDIMSFVVANPEKVSYLQLTIGLLFHIPTVWRIFYFKLMKTKYETLMCYLEYETLDREISEISKVFQVEKYASRKFNKIYMLTVLISSLGFTLPSVLAGFYNILGNRTGKVFKVELAFPLSLPYNMDTAAGYCTSSVQMFVQVEVATFVLVGTDLLIAGLMRTVASHLKCLAKWFSIIQTNKNVITNNQNHRQPEDEFIKAVKYLQRIYKGHRDLENLQNFMLFIQYICSVAILAVGLYRSTKDFKVDAVLLKSLGFFVIVLFQPFLYCYFGDMVSREVENVKMALYDSNWIGTRLGYQRMVLLTLTRLNKPLIFTCGKLIALSSPAFLTIINTAYSAFNLLKRSNQNN